MYLMLGSTSVALEVEARAAEEVEAGQVLGAPQEIEVFEVGPLEERREVWRRCVSTGRVKASTLRPGS
jgi:hypothetical protein